MTDPVTEALTAARQAHEAATEALLVAEAAARSAGSFVEPRVLDELTVKRINVVEDDGTLRIVIGNSTHGRAIPMRGRLVEHPGRTASAGLLFVNDDGTECGGLQYTGSEGPGGAQQSGYLTVDDYEQNESVRFGMVQRDGRSEKFLEFIDRPGWSIVDLAERPAEADASVGGHSRMRLAREDDGSVRLVLRDGEGRDRVRLVVPAEGEPAVEIVGVDGVARSLG